MKTTNNSTPKKGDVIKLFGQTDDLPEGIETNQYGQYRCVFNADGVELTSQWSASLPSIEKALNELKAIFGNTGRR